MTRYLRNFFCIVAVFATLASSACVFTKNIEGTLYKRLGEREGIHSIVDNLVLNCVIDQRINSFFLAAATNPKRLGLFKSNLEDQICEASGGPCRYSGKDMKTAHAGMGVSDQHFNAFVENLVKALDAHEISKPDQELLLGMLGPSRKDVVEVHS